MGGRDTKNGVANPEQQTPEKPCDLGYYVGYKICQAYSEQAAAKKRAVADLLPMPPYLTVAATPASGQGNSR